MNQLTPHIFFQVTYWEGGGLCWADWWTAVGVWLSSERLAGDNLSALGMVASLKAALFGFTLRWKDPPVISLFRVVATTGPLLQSRLRHYHHDETVHRIYFFWGKYTYGGVVSLFCRCFYFSTCYADLIIKKRTKRISIQHTDHFLFRTCPNFFFFCTFTISSQHADHFLFCTCPNFFFFVLLSTNKVLQKISSSAFLSFFFFFCSYIDRRHRALMKHPAKAVQLHIHT